MSWTDERVETLKKMWAEGQSASQIAKELGAVTRNAVIGKVHRLGLSNRVGPGGKDDGDEAEMPAAAPVEPPRAAEAPRAAEPAPAAPGAATGRRTPGPRCGSPRDPDPADPAAQGDHPRRPAPAAAAFGQ